jgi:hypothetical protein
LLLFENSRVNDEEQTCAAGQSGWSIHISDEALYRTLDYTISYLASGVSVSYLQKCQLYEAL